MISFTATEPILLTVAVLCAITTAYFLSLQRKTRDLRFLIGAFSCWTAHFVLALCREALCPIPEWFAVAKVCIGLTGLVLFVAFAYHFRENPYPHEFRIGFACACTLVALCSAFFAYAIATHRPVFWCIGTGVAIVLFVWAETVLIRRWVRAKSFEEARGHRSFALVFVCSLAAVVVLFLRDIGVLHITIASLVSSLLFIATLVWFTFAYVNNGPRPATIRVRIAGAALFAVLAVVTVMWTMIAALPAAAATSAHDADSHVSDAYVRSYPPSEQISGTSKPMLQRSVVMCNWCIIGSTLFVLGFFPVFFRVNLNEPLNMLLQAVELVQLGCRDIQLAVRSNDEIGRLTLNFNVMTRSLKMAEDDLKCYTEELELKVLQRTTELNRKNEENERLLLNIIPGSIADRLKNGELLIADAYPEASILFADIVGFTDLSTRIPACELVAFLSGLMCEFDHLAEQHGVEKIKMIGDAYMAVAGLPNPRPDHAHAAVCLAIDMLNAAKRCRTCDGTSLQLRIGINSGPVIAGVIGRHKFAYDLWGDTVNTAARMESQGQPGRIQVTEATYALVRGQRDFEPCGEVYIKGKGLMRTYFVADEGANHENKMLIGDVPPPPRTFGSLGLPTPTDLGVTTAPVWLAGL